MFAESRRTTRLSGTSSAQTDQAARRLNFRELPSCTRAAVAAAGPAEATVRVKIDAEVDNASLKELGMSEVIAAG